MFARIVSMHLKPNTYAEFTHTFDKDVIPTLRKQQGFRDEILFGGTQRNRSRRTQPVGLERERRLL